MSEYPEVTAIQVNYFSPTYMKLLISLLSGLLFSTVVEGHLVHSVSKPHALRSLNGVVYRKYQEGDDLSLVEREYHRRLSCGFYLCWVAVPSGKKVRLL